MKTIKKFSFQQVTEEQVRQVILSIDGSKATPVWDIPADMLKVALDIHLSLMWKSLICRLKIMFYRQFRNCERKTMIQIKKTIGLSVFCLMCQKFLEESFAAKFRLSCKRNCQTY